MSARDLIRKARAMGIPLDNLIVVTVDAGPDMVIPPMADSSDGPEPPGVLTIRRVVESAEALCLDSEDDREALIYRLAVALGLA